MQSAGRLRLHYARNSSDEIAPVTLAVEYKNDAHVGDFSAALLAADWCDFREGETLSVVADGTRLSDDTLIKDAQLVEGVLLGPSEKAHRMRAVLSEGDQIRAVHADGAQNGFAWPLRADSAWNLKLRGFMLLESDASDADLTIELLSDDICQVSLRKTNGLVVRVNGWEQTTSVVEVRSGSVLSLAFEDQVLTLRILRPADALASQPSEGLVRLRPQPDPDASFPEPLRLSLQAPKRPEMRPWDWKEQIAQPVAMASAYLLIGLFVGFNPYFLIILVVPLISVVLSYRRHTRAQNDQITGYNDSVRALDTALGTLQKQVKQESELIFARNPSLEELAADLFRRRGRFWCRAPEAPDFLRIALGRGTYLSPSDLTIESEVGNNEAVVWEEDVYDTRLLDDGPVLWEAASEHCAFLGSSGSVRDFVSDAIARLVLTHSPDDLTVLALLPADDEVMSDYGWLAGLPHARTDPHLGGQDLIVRGAYVSGAVRDWTMTLRRQSKAQGEGRHRLLLIHEGALLSSGALEDLVKAGSITVCWVGSSPSLIPQMISRRLYMSRNPFDESFTLVNEMGREEARADAVSGRSTILAVSRSIESCLDEGGRESGAGIPVRVPAGQLVDVDLGTDSSAKRLLARVGLSDAGPVDLDLVADGPHLLVAGTTGSGKSELLRSLILALATRYTPREVCLLLIDFKGGASLGDLAGMHGEVGLPHVIGSVTNLGAHDVNRLILFLREEVVRRQRILAPFNGEYERYRAARQGSALMPRLVVVIDEFAGFMDPSGGSTGGGVSRDAAILEVAARGRSLGVHLVIATQSPKGVVTGQVSANVNARIALRVLDPADSDSIIGSSAAAGIQNLLKGRAFAKLEDGNLIQFQSGFTGADYLFQQSDQRLRAELLPFGLEFYMSPPTSEPNSRADDREEVTPDDAEIIRRRLAALYARHLPTQIAHKLTGFAGFVDMPILAESPLSPSFERASASPRAERQPGEVAIGTQDRPASQQGAQPYFLPLHAGAAIAYGRTRSGRTSMLQAASIDFRNENPGGVIVTVDGARGNLGVRCGADWALIVNGPGDIHHLSRQLEQDYGPLTSPTLVLIDRLDLIADFFDLETWSRIFANGGARRVFTLATADPRLTIEPRLRRAFYWLLEAVDGYEGIFTEVSDEWSLIAVRKVVPAAVTVQPSAVPRSLLVAPTIRDYVLDAGKRPVAYGVFESAARNLDGWQMAVGWDRVRHEEVLIDFPPGDALGIAGTQIAGRTRAAAMIAHLLSQRDSTSTFYLTASDAPTPFSSAVQDLKQHLALLGSSVDSGAELADKALAFMRGAGEAALVIDLEGDSLDRLLRGVVIGSTASKQSPESFGDGFWTRLWEHLRERQITVVAAGHLRAFISQYARSQAFSRESLRLLLVPPELAVAESIPGITTSQTQRRFFNWQQVPYAAGTGRLLRDEGEDPVEVAFYDVAQEETA